MIHVSSMLKSVQESKAAFKSFVKYYQLKKPEDYRVLCVDMQRQMQAVGLKERGRIFYLSVPPFAYAGIAASINQGNIPLSLVGVLTHSERRPPKIYS